MGAGDRLCIRDSQNEGPKEQAHKVGEDSLILLRGWISIPPWLQLHGHYPLAQQH